jgi:hypothetical protein
MEYGKTDYWNDGVMEYWSDGQGDWSAGVMEYRSVRFSAMRSND